MSQRTGRVVHRREALRTMDDDLRLWQARDAYRMQTVGIAVLCVMFLVLAVPIGVAFMQRGVVAALAASIYLAWGFALAWSVRWLWRRWKARGLRMVVLALVCLGCFTSGCAGYACAPAKWSGYDCPTPGMARTR